MTAHKNVPQGQIHPPVNWTFTTATNRRAPGVYVDDQLGAEAMQTDTSPPTFWKLVALSGSLPNVTPQWRKVATESDQSAVGTILGAEPAWWIDGVSSTIVDAGSSLASSASDASGHGFDATFTSTHRPLIVASGLNGKRTLRFTSSQYGGNASFAAPAPGTTPIYTFMVVKTATAVASTVFLGTGSNNIYVGTGPRVDDYNGGTGPFSSVLTPGTWYILEILRTNSNTDYIQLGGTGGTVGTSAGNAANTGYTLNATSAGAQGNDCEYATAFQWVGTPPDNTKRTALRAWANGVWGV